MRCRYIGRLSRERDLDRCRAPWDERGELSLPYAQERFMHVRRIRLALYNIQHRDITTTLPRRHRHHPILGLQQSPHDVEHSGLAHGLGSLDVGRCEGRVRGHEVVAAGRGDEGGDDAAEVVVHVAWVAEGGCGGGHGGGDELVCLLEGGFLDVEAVGSDAGEGAIVEDDLSHSD